MSVAETMEAAVAAGTAVVVAAAAVAADAVAATAFAVMLRAVDRKGSLHSSSLHARKVEDFRTLIDPMYRVRCLHVITVGDRNGE